MKKIKNLALVCMSLFCFTSCISSEFVGVETALLSDDKSMEGTWVYVPKAGEKDELGVIPTKITVSKGAKKGEYFAEMLSKPKKEGETAKLSPKIPVFLGKLKGVTFFSMKGKAKPKNKGDKDFMFFNGVYQLNESALIIQLVMEKEAVANKKATGNIGDPKPTVFANAKAVQDFLKKNMVSLDYLSDELNYKKE